MPRLSISRNNSPLNEALEWNQLAANWQTLRSQSKSNSCRSQSQDNLVAHISTESNSSWALNWLERRVYKDRRTNWPGKSYKRHFKCRPRRTCIPWQARNFNDQRASSRSCKLIPNPEATQPSQASKRRVAKSKQ